MFDHRDFPEVGTQVVGGTVEENEDFKMALKREIFEEAGLITDTKLMSKIGETIYHRKDKPEQNIRHYYEVITNDLPDSWSHIVESSGADNGMVFHFYWMPIHEAKLKLDGNFGELL